MPKISLDASTDFGRHVLRRLDQEFLIWLTTIGHSSGTPIPSVVWYLWNGSEVLILSQPDKPKLRNVEANPSVALNLETARGGGDVAVLSGTAVYDRNGLTDREFDAYAAKYSDGIARLGYGTPRKFVKSFSELIRVTPERVRGFAG